MQVGPRRPVSTHVPSHAAQSEAQYPPGSARHASAASHGDIAVHASPRAWSGGRASIAIGTASGTGAKKLDPIRESEGVGRGTVAFGKGVTTLDKQLSITGPASFVVDVDGKVQLVSTASDPTALDARDAKVTDLEKNIKDYTS